MSYTARPYTAEQQYTGLTMFAKGATLAEVCAATGVSDYSARQIKNKLGDVGVTLPEYKVAVWDIETSDFKADIGSLMVSSFLDLATGIPNSRSVLDFEGTFAERERQLAVWTREQIASCDTLIGHNVKAFDRNFVNGVSARYGLPIMPKRTYLDTYLIARYGIKGLIGYSMANLADVLGLPIPKDSPSKNDWRLYIAGDPAAVARITERCELDVIVNALLWEELKMYHYEWKGER